MFARMSPVAERIQELLNAKGMTRADLARLAGLPYHRINPWFVRPNSKASGQDLFEVAKVLGVSASYLLHGTDNETSREAVIRAFDQLSEAGQAELQNYAEFLLLRSGLRDPS